MWSEWRLFLDNNIIKQSYVFFQIIFLLEQGRCVLVYNPLDIVVVEVVLVHNHFGHFGGVGGAGTQFFGYFYVD